MSDDPVTYTVELPPPPPPRKLERERAAFLGLLPELLKTHRGKYVAVHEGRVVAEGDTRLEAAVAAHKTVGYVELYVGLVALPPEEETIRIPHYRIVPPETP